MEGTKIVSYHIKWSTYRTTQTQLGCVRNSFNVSGSQVHSFDLCEILKWPKKKEKPKRNDCQRWEFRESASSTRQRKKSHSITCLPREFRWLRLDYYCCYEWCCCWEKIWETSRKMLKRWNRDTEQQKREWEMEREWYIIHDQNHLL